MSHLHYIQWFNTYSLYSELHSLHIHYIHYIVNYCWFEYAQPRHFFHGMVQYAPILQYWGTKPISKYSSSWIIITYVHIYMYIYIDIHIYIHTARCVYIHMYIILYTYIYIILLYINDTGFNSPTREWLIWYASAPVELSFSLLYQLFSEKHGSPDGQIRWNGHWIDSRDTEEQGRLVAHAFLRSLSLYALMSISYVCIYICICM